MAVGNISCARCQVEFPKKDADYSADGLICRKCAVNADVAQRLGVATADDGALQLAERGLLRSKYVKHTIIGIGGLVIGIPLAYFLGWATEEAGPSRGGLRGLVLAISLVVGGCIELARGISGLARLPAKPKRE